MRALSYSSSVSLEDPEADPDSEVESEELSKGALASMLLVSFGFAIVLFFLLPLFASRPLEGAFGNDILSNVAEGAIRLAVFVAYIWVIGRMAEIRRVFMYHGAEHMTVHAQERGDPLVAEAIRKYSPAHPRCGTAFLLTVMVVAILVFVFVPREPLWWLVASRIVFIPLIAAVAYEVIRLSGRYEDNPLVRLISAPNLLLQKLTTRWPDDDQIEVAVAAMETALQADRRVELRLILLWSCTPAVSRGHRSCLPGAHHCKSKNRANRSFDHPVCCRQQVLVGRSHVVCGYVNQPELDT